MPTDPPEDSDSFGWPDYEELVKHIYETLGSRYGGSIECWGPTCRVEGPPGALHQIDVLANTSDGLHRYRTAISCRWRNEKVSVDHVREWSFIVQEARLSKGVIVSKAGFTQPARWLAEPLGIELVELREPTEEDLSDSVEEAHIELVIDGGTALTEVRFRRAVPVAAADGGIAEERMPMPDLLLIAVPGQPERTLLEVADAAYRADPNKELYELEYPHGTAVSIPNAPGHPAHGRAIRSLSFKIVQHPPIRQSFTIRPHARIRMMMRSLFDRRLFIITKDGQVIESTERD